MIGPRLVALLTLVSMSGLAIAAAVPAPPARAVDAVDTAASPLTRTGTGPFADLAVTVSDTENLGSGVVTVSWTGGAPTVGSATEFRSNYLQIMQCWGDDPVGPDRTQCQFGGRNTFDVQAGRGVTSREVFPPSQAVTTARDPNETAGPPGVNGEFSIPFAPFNDPDRSVTIPPSGASNRYFDQTTTNEVPYARTFADGTGISAFEVQTGSEAAGLGCGGDVAGSPRPCWLVVVPRGDREADGSSVGSGYLSSSPLSASNWENRIVFPLTFAPLNRACDVSSDQLRVVGHPLVSEAMTQWLPGLCATKTAEVAFSDIGDLLVRRQLTSADRPTMGILSQGLPGGGGGATYAPVAVSGLTLSFLVERQYDPSVPEEEQLEASKRVESMRLTPRLVAKLLTNSYSAAVPPRNPTVAGNPAGLVDDPEFIALNPQFATLRAPTLTDVLVTGEVLDAYGLVWRWIDGDATARAWLNGEADESGMVVNPAYQNIALPINEFPKADTYCTPPGAVPGSQDLAAPPLCPFDWRPYAASLPQASREGSRGNNLSRSVLSLSPPAWRPAGTPGIGSRSIMVLTTSALADRYGLPSAELLTGAGEYVGATVEALTNAASTATVDTDTGTLRTDPRADTTNAYPLTVISNASVVRSKVTDDGVRRQFADIIRAFATDLQRPGRGVGLLPEGYAPLPAELRRQALEAADAIAAPLPTAAATTTPASATGSTTARADTPAAAPPPATTAAAVAPASTTARRSVPSTRPRTTAAPVSAAPAEPVVAPGLEATTSSTPPVSVGAAAAAATTPATDDSPLRWVPVVALLTGAAAAVTGPLLMRGGSSGRRTG